MLGSLGLFLIVAYLIEERNLIPIDEIDKNGSNTCASFFKSFFASDQTKFLAQSVFAELCPQTE